VPPPPPANVFPPAPPLRTTATPHAATRSRVEPAPSKRPPAPARPLAPPPASPPPLALAPPAPPRVYLDFPEIIADDPRRARCTKIFEEFKLPLTPDATAALHVELHLDTFQLKITSPRRGVVLDVRTDARNAIDLCRLAIARVEDALGAE
jgi:hypothetical protein